VPRLARAPALAWAALILTIAIRAACRVVARAAVTHAFARSNGGFCGSPRGRSFSCRR